MSFLKGVSPGGVFERENGTILNLLIWMKHWHTLSLEYYWLTVNNRRWVGRKEGRERGKEEMNSLRLKELSNSDLYRRRQERPDSYGSLAGESFRWVYLYEAFNLLSNYWGECVWEVLTQICDECYLCHYIICSVTDILTTCFWVPLNLYQCTLLI